MFWQNFIRLCNLVGEKPNAVAKKCGVKSSGTVTAWGKGGQPRDRYLIAIADYFGVDADSLLNREITVSGDQIFVDGIQYITKKPSPASGESERIQRIKRIQVAMAEASAGLSEEQLNEVMAFIEFKQRQKGKK